jgi:hypothetical protein
MFRKTILALAATAAIGGAALVPTSASAFPLFHPHWHGHFGWFGGGFGPGYDDGGCYSERRIVITPFGPRVRRVVVCD